jgi:hypothetical protein
LRLQLVAPLSSTQLVPLKIKTYPHFDGPLAQTDALKLASDPFAVAHHPFYPFIEYSERWTRFAPKGFTGTVKSRPIKYAARRDSCIYAYYRSLLSDLYEDELKKRGISESVLAYRRIPKMYGVGNKCNIHFAKDAFGLIGLLGACYVYAFDIKSFFDNLDHRFLKRQWSALLGVSSLPLDHFAVFRNVTKFGWVDREMVYRVLGMIGTKVVNGQQVQGYLVNRVPMQICKPDVFRSKIMPIVRYNSTGKGIPQGSPISDVLANLYLLNFDSNMAEFAKAHGGAYLRYSDDILLILPDLVGDIDEPSKIVQSELQSCGGSLSIQPQKTTVHQFASQQGAVTFKLIQGAAGRNGLEYLGFRFDGKRTFVRDSTRSRLQRKLTFAVRGQVNALRHANPLAGRAALKAQFDPKVVLRQFHQVREFHTVAKSPTDWTFWTYVVRASGTFDQSADPIRRQFRRLRQSIVYKAHKFIDKTVQAP